MPLPLSNDGVTDDPNRVSPKEGTRGTEGGVSEKSKDNGKLPTEKVPETPKEAPPGVRDGPVEAVHILLYSPWVVS